MTRPWSVDQFLRVIGGNCLGALLVAVGWFESATAASGDVQRRLTWLGLAMAGLAMAGISNGLWMLRGRRLVAVARSAATVELHDALRGTTTHTASTTRLVTVARSSRYHRSDCPLVAAKPADSAARAALELQGLVPCEICRP